MGENISKDNPKNETRSLLYILKEFKREFLEELVGNRHLAKIQKLDTQNGILFEEIIQKEPHLIVKLTIEEQTSKNERMKEEAKYEVKIIDEQSFQYKCSCGKQHRIGNKVCIHVATLLWFILENKRFPEIKLKEPKQILTQQEKKQIKEEVLKGLTDLKEFKLDGIIVLEALNEINEFVNQQILLGLQRTSAINIDHLKTLIIKAHLAKLTVLERQLQGIEEFLRDYLLKENKPISEYLFRLHRVKMFTHLTKELLSGTKHPYLRPVDILGLPRSKYFPVDDFQAFSIGAQGWVTDSGFVGVTLYLVKINSPTNNKSDQIFTITNVRPSQYIGSSDPRFIFNLDTPAGYRLSDIAYGGITVRNAKVNHKSQLSMSKELVIYPIEATEIQSLQIHKIMFSNWLDVLEHFKNHDYSLFNLQDFEKNLVFLEPKSYGSFIFDPISSKWEADLYDGSNYTITLDVKDSPEKQRTITNLTKLFNDQFLPNIIFGRLFINNSGRLALDPFTGVYYQGYKIQSSKSTYRSSRYYYSRKREYKSLQGVKQNLKSIFHFSLDNAKNITPIN